MFKKLFVLAGTLFLAGCATAVIDSIDSSQSFSDAAFSKNHVPLNSYQPIPVAGAFEAVFSTSDRSKNIFSKPEKYIIYSSMGSGNGHPIGDFVQAAREVLANGWHVTIAGHCVSACIEFADLARPNISITTDAKFGFHKASIMCKGTPNYEYYFPLPYLSRDIDDWVMAHGGYPRASTLSGVLFMNANDASAFWPMAK